MWCFSDVGMDAPVWVWDTGFLGCWRRMLCF